MKVSHLSILFTALLVSAVSVAQGIGRDRPDWGVYFEKLDAKGTIVLVDGRITPEATSVFGSERAKKRYSPASTYKVPHTLFALDAGAVRDEFQIFPWDGVERSYPPHNQDQNLRSAMRNSALWVYELFAKEIGDKNAAKYLNKIDYGNRDPRTKDGAYWVYGDLAISAYEQVAFLQRLYRNELPFKLEHQLLVKDVMVTEAGRNWILRAKTGWDGKHGWWIGWVEWFEGPVFFALNIDTPNGMKDLYKREAIAREILESIQALPSSQPIQPATKASAGLKR